VHLDVDAAPCTGCRICESFCSLTHEGASWPERSRIRIVSASDEGPFVPAVCRQCEDAPCAAACPLEAITLDKRTGARIVDPGLCTFCGACRDACPYGAVWLDEERQVTFMCDLCRGQPQCVPLCPKDVLRIVG
jgi:Fe-S-cluster-containing hydrogenase component 2